MGWVGGALLQRVKVVMEREHLTLKMIYEKERDGCLYNAMSSIENAISNIDLYLSDK
jgi:hypothetical protein